ncbi:MAG: flippase [Thermoplasmata archaeon]
MNVTKNRCVSIETQENQQDNNDSSSPEDTEEVSSFDQELVTKSLGKVGKGAGILFAGTILGIFFNFLARIVIARFYTPDHYGQFNLFLTFLTIFAYIGMLGLTNGISRFIGYYTGTGEAKKIKEVEGWGLLLGAMSGIFFGAFLFLTAPLLAPLFSDDALFVDYLRIAAVTIPFYVILRSILSIFRGHQRTKENILFYSFGRNTAFLSLTVLVGIFSLPLIGVMWSMFTAVVLMAVISYLYYLKNQKSLLSSSGSFSFTPSIGKKILLFSLPLVLVDLMHQVMGWADTLMIGIYLTEDAVGFYNVAKPLSVFISAGLSITIFIYTPLVSGLYARKKFQENHVIFSVLTKWVCFLTLPFAMILFLYSKEIIFIFGSEYLPAIIPLQILVIFYFINNLMGPNGATLTAYGKTKFLMYATCLAAGMNIGLNILLIPIYGIIGAAVATGISVLSANIARSYKLYSLSGVHSFGPNNIKPVVSTVITGTLFVMFLKITPIPGVIQVPLAFLSLTFLYLLTASVTRSISKQDMELLMLIEDKTGVKLTFLRRLLNRFA